MSSIADESLSDENKQTSESTRSHPSGCECVICGNNKPFDLNKDLISSFIEGKLAIFAGAGISTEAKVVVGYTFYDEIVSELGPSSKGMDFPDLISAYCAQPNGRIKLIEKINQRFLNIKSTPEFYWYATRFHSALAPVSVIDTIITTNWDNFFEQECWATPFVFAEDTAFWQTADRKLLKIHGTVENLGSIVASKEDYERCRERLATGLIGSRLKTILAEKTVVFCGYSLKDFDFQEIMRFVQSEMQGFQRQAYVITLDSTEEARQRFTEFNVIPIITDGTFFIESLKKEWFKLKHIVPDEMYDYCSDFLAIVQEVHNEFAEKTDMFDHPRMIYSLFYQDGLIHALSRIALLRKTGEYSNREITLHKIAHYENLYKKAVKLRRYDDASYIDGYINGLTYSASCKEEADNCPPLFFSFGKDRYFDSEEYNDFLIKKEDPHRPSSKVAAKIVSQYKRGDDVIPDHACRLFGLQ